MFKLNSINKKINDLYTFSAKLMSPQTVPDVHYPDIYNYLIDTPSVYTKGDLKAYKSLDAYTYLLVGWIGDISVHYVKHSNEKVIMCAQVYHSQAVNASTLQPWVAANKDGTIIYCHCTYKACLGKAYS